MKENLHAIDWIIPTVDQHRIRYMDQTLHAIFANTDAPVTYERAVARKDGLSPDMHTVSIPKDELVKIRNHVLFKRRQNFIDTGGDQEMIDANIRFGAQAEVHEAHTGLVTVRRKL